IGGVPVYLEKQGRDTHSGFVPTGPGCVTLTGGHALAFARSRYYETLVRPGYWEPDSSSDIGRIRRQQEFMRAALQKAIDRGANPILNVLKTVRVEVRNGNGTLGYGKQVADGLGAVGFSTKSVDNPLYKSDKTIIKYASGADPQQTKLALFNALVLARYMDV